MKRTANAGTSGGIEIDRRGLLRRLGVGAAAGTLAPLLPVMEREVRGATGYPIRFVVWWNGQGTVAPAWVPIGTETNFQLSEILSPLQPFKDRLAIIEGLYMQSVFDEPNPAGGHIENVAHVLTGDYIGRGMSVDQKIASAIGKDVLNIGALAGSTSLSHRGTNQPYPSTGNPLLAFDQIFGGVGLPLPGVDPKEALRREKEQRHRIFDVLAKHRARARNLVGREGYEKIDRHWAGLEKVVSDLDAFAEQLGSFQCQKPTLNFSGFPRMIINQFDQQDLYVAAGELHSKLGRAALACDLNRVVVFQWGTGGSGGAVPEAGIVAKRNGGTNSYHGVAHFWQGHELGYSHPAYYKANWTKLQKFYARQLASFLTLLKEVPEGSGTLLDNTVVLWTNGMSHGAHQFGPWLNKGLLPNLSMGIPNVLFAGRNVVGVRTNVYLKPHGLPHNRLLVSLCQIMGLKEVLTFGNPKYGSGPLPDLLRSV